MVQRIGRSTYTVLLVDLARARLSVCCCRSVCCDRLLSAFLTCYVVLGPYGSRDSMFLLMFPSHGGRRAHSRQPRKAGEAPRCHGPVPISQSSE